MTRALKDDGVDDPGNAVSKATHSQLAARAVEAAVDAALGEVARQGGFSARQILVEARGEGMLAALPFLMVLDEKLIEVRDAIRALHALVDQTDPNDPIGVALTKVGLERVP
jgi:hypothetical protein